MCNVYYAKRRCSVNSDVLAAMIDPVPDLPRKQPKLQSIFRRPAGLLSVVRET